MISLITYLFVRLGKILFAAIPFRLLYPVSNSIAWLLQHILKYRYQTTLENLRRAFPNAPEHEIMKYLEASYRNFSDIMLETIKGFTLPEAEIGKRFSFTNPEHLHQYFQAGKSVVLTLGHTGNWEWAGLALGKLAPGQVLCVYHRLKNPLIDKMILEERSRTGLLLFPKGETIKLISHLRRINGAMMLAADQSPANAAAAKWVSFFNTETGFVPGPERVSRRFHFPLVHLAVRRLDRGFYEATFHTLSDQPDKEAENALTQKYADAMENEIRNAPPNWLWSHKRWKKKKPAILKER